MTLTTQVVTRQKQAVAIASPTKRLVWISMLSKMEMCIRDRLYRDDLNKVSFVLESYQDHLDSKEAFPQLEAHTWGGLSLIHI